MDEQVIEHTIQRKTKVSVMRYLLIEISFVKFIQVFRWTECYPENVKMFLTLLLLRPTI